MRHLKSFNCDFATLLSSPLIAVTAPLWAHLTVVGVARPNPLKSRWSINSLYFLLMCVCRVSLSDFCNVSLISFQLNEAAKRLTIGDSSSNSSRTNSPGGVWLNELSCMGTESEGRGITTVFFKPVSHQSCQSAVEQTMASCCIWGLCRE